MKHRFAMGRAGIKCYGNVECTLFGIDCAFRYKGGFEVTFKVATGTQVGIIWLLGRGHTRSPEAWMGFAVERLVDICCG